MRQYRVAVVGATGAVGTEMLHVLERRGFPVQELCAFASERSVGRTVRFRDADIPVQVLRHGVFRGVDLALFSAGAACSAEFAPAAVEAGAVAIDNSSAFRMRPEVPLVVPEVNAHHLEAHKGLIAVPNCSTIQMVMPLRVMRDLFGLERVVVATYQSVSGAGRRSMQELEQAAHAFFHGKPEPRQVYPRGIAFEVVPQVSDLDAEGFTSEELKMQNETRKILEMPHLPVHATCVRVPVFRCHSEAVWVWTERPVDLGRLHAGLAAQAGLVFRPVHTEYPLARECAERDAVFVGRLRRDPENERALGFWVVADNLLKGAALNAVQIAEHLEGARLTSPS